MKLKDIIFKDLRIVLRDRVALMFIFLMPIVLIVILSFALGGLFAAETISIGQVQAAVVDYDNEAADSATFEASIYTLLNNEDIAAFLSYQTLDEASAMQKLSDGVIDAVITIPKGFSNSVQTAMSGGGSNTLVLSVTGSPNSTFKAGVIRSIVTAYADTLSMLSGDMTLLFDTVVKSGQMQAMTQIDFGSFIQQISESPGLSVDEQGVAARKALTSYAYYTIAITCMFLLFSAGQGSNLLYTESEERTLQRLSAAGISRVKLLCGKAVVVFLLCLLQLVVLLGFSTLVFGLDWGNTLVFIAISVCVAVSVTGLGALLMVLVYRMDRPGIGSVFQSVIVQVFALIGGSFIPLSVLPAFFSTLALFTPNGLAVMAYTGNVSGAPIAEILPYMAGSITLGLVLLIAGAVLFPRERRA